MPEKFIKKVFSIKLIYVIIVKYAKEKLSRTGGGKEI